MIIKFSPCRMDKVIAVSVAGDVLTIAHDAGVDELDFSSLTEGAELPASATGSEWVAENVSRVGGQISVVILLPLAADAGEAARFPSLVAIDNGAVEIPQ